MDPFMMSSSTTAPPVPTVEMGQGSGTPQLGSNHHGAHSDSNAGITSYDDLARFDPFDINFIGSPDLPPLPEVVIDPMAFPVEELSYLNSGSSIPVGSLEDTDLLDYCLSDCGGFSAAAAAENLGVNKDVVPAVSPVVHQAQQGVCMDGSVTNASTDADDLSSMANNNNEVVKKGMPPEKVAELAAVDPRRAKRIIANRESAARSKERRIQYTTDLENKVKKLQAESTEISIKLAKLEEESSDAKAVKKEISRDIESMDERAKLVEKLNEALKDKLRRLEEKYKQKVAFKHHNFRELVSQFSFRLAQDQVALLHQLRSDQPNNVVQWDSEDSRVPTHKIS